MAPPNGVTVKLDNPPRRTAPVFPVVPVIPLTYTQRPVKKQTPAPPVVASSVENTAQKALDPSIPNGHHERQNGDPVGCEQTSAGEGRDTNTPSPVPPSNSDSVQSAISSAVLTPPTVVSGGHAEGTIPRPSALPLSRLNFRDALRVAQINSPTSLDTISAAPTPLQALGPSNPISEYPPVVGPAPGLPLPAPQPFVPNRAAFHQVHPSNGGLVSGGFHESNEHSFQHPNQFRAAAHHQFQGHPAAFDGFTMAHINHSNHHGPPTPHSFQGSQSSAQAEEQSYSRYPPMNAHSSYPAQRMAPPPPEINYPFQQEETMDFLRQQYHDDALRDCYLSVQFAANKDFWDHPEYSRLDFSPKFPGHRLMFARSPLLLGTMKQQGMKECIQLKLSNEYVRPDVFRYVLDTLYGWYWLDRPFPSDLPYRDPRDEFKTALGYISTARYLRLGSLEVAAAHRASMLLDWGTIETAARFISESAIFSAPAANSGSVVFINAVVGWLARNFLSNFVIDINAGHFGFPRLPEPSPSPLPKAEADSRQPSKAQVQMPRDSRIPSNPRLSQISFGEIASVENQQSFPSLFPNTGHSQVPRLEHTILSRILLHLPFEILKVVVEHPYLAELQGEYTRDQRLAMVTKIIEARESLRLRAVDKTSERLQPFHKRLETASKDREVLSKEDYWVNTMGFKEEVFSGDIPFLVRTWTVGQSDSGLS